MGQRGPVEGRITAWLGRQSPGVFSVYAVAAAFSTYFAMYAFRKPFAVAQYEGQSLGFIDLKSALVIGQVVGYALSKVLGVKFVSELPASRRRAALFLMIGWAEAALLLFAVLPGPWKVVAIFANGLPLGAVWGLVFGYLEGRRTSEILGAGLSCAYIVASGAVKSVGKGFLESGVSESWMPFVTGLAFLPVFAGTVWLLSQLPPPTPEDVAVRVEREPMTRTERRAFFLRYLPGLLPLTVLYFFLTAYRDFRDNFAAEIWTELGWGTSPTIFTISELPIALSVMGALALLYLVKDNRRGLLFAHGIMLAGAVLIGVATLLYDAGLLQGVWWMVLVGLGLYLGYVPYGCVLFDRMIAALGVVATAVFMIYLTDAVGYVGSVGVLVYKNLAAGSDGVLGFFRAFSYFTAVVCAGCFVASASYFAKKSREAPPVAETAPPRVAT